MDCSSIVNDQRRSVHHSASSATCTAPEIRFHERLAVHEDAPWRESRRPNVLLITCDQWRGDCLSAAGHPVVRTPNADALAAEGVLFRATFARRRALLAGARLPLHRPLPDEQPRLPQRHAARRPPRQHRACRPRASATIRRCSATPTSRPTRASMRRAILCCAAMKACCRASRVRQLLPEHQKPWLSWLAGARRRCQRRLSRHPPPGGRGARRRVTNAPPVYSQRRDAGGLPGRRIHPLARRAGAAALVRASLLHQPAPALHRAGALQHACTIRPTARLSAARKAGRPKPQSHPYLAYDLGRQKRTNSCPA